MSRPALVFAHHERGSGSIGICGQHGRIELVKQTRNGDVEVIIGVELEDGDKLNIIAQPTPQPQDAP